MPALGNRHSRPSGREEPRSIFYDQCSAVTGWGADLTASGKAVARGTTLGTYSTTMGPTTPYTPSASSETQLVSQLSAALSIRCSP